MKKMIVTLLTCILTVNMIMPVSAATPQYEVHFYSFSINDTKMDVKEGDSFSVRVTGSAVTFGKTTWTTSDESVVKIESAEKGSYGLNDGYKVNLYAVKGGTAVISARNSKKSDVLTCIVKVEGDQTDKPEPDPKTPIITSAVSTGTTKAGSIKISWDAVEDASKYHIQIATDKDFSTTYRDAVTKNAYYNTGWNYYNQIGSGTKRPYYCRVKAIMSDGTESPWADIVTCEEK